MLLWEEYRQREPGGYGYSRWCELYRAWEGRLSPTMRQAHRAGERMFVDYAGQTVELIDGRSGEIRQAQIFVAVMGASSYTYAEASWTQTLPDWIGSHARVHAHSPAKAGPTGITAPISCHTFRATGITAYLANGGALEHAANRSLNIVCEIPCGHRWVSPPKIRFAPDSP